MAHGIEGSGVSISIIQPGIINTPIWEKSSQTAEALASAMPPKAHEYYDNLYERVRKIIKRVPDLASPAERVSNAVLHAITARKPRTRYMVGIDAYIDKLLARWLPDRLRDWVICWFFRI